MPKIAADSVHEHVARQEAAVIEAAIRLFNERGVRDVNLGDIAKEVGLARNSLYRYFPDKAHILAAWFRSTVAPLVEECAEIAASDDPPVVRIRRWVDAQFDYLTAPDHAAMLLASGELTDLPDDVRTELGAGHRELYASLSTVLNEAFRGKRGRSVEVVTLLVAALVRGAAEQVRAGADPSVVRAELRRATAAIVSA